MVDGIFNDRLKGDLIAIIAKTAFIHLKFILKLILISKFLDLQIASGDVYKRQAVRSLTSGVIDSHGVTGGVYKTRERIHRGILIRDY